MTYTEELIYTDYVTERRGMSRLLPLKAITLGWDFRCPRCAHPRNDLEHGELFVCKCGLAMRRFGNGLIVWEAADATNDAV